MRKRFLSITRVLCLLFTLFPVPAFAATEILVDGISYALITADVTTVAKTRTSQTSVDFTL